MKKLLHTIILLLQAAIGQAAVGQAAVGQAATVQPNVGQPVVVQAGIALPDSLLTLHHAYHYNLTSPDTSLAIVEGMRRRQLAARWELDVTEGDIYYNSNQFLRALPYFQRAYADGIVKDSTRIQLMLLKRLAYCSKSLNRDAALTECIYTMLKLSQDYGNPHYEAIAKFLAGWQTHYHGEKDEGYRLCREALELMSRSDRRSKTIETQRFYATLVKMYTDDHRYADALQMSHLQEKWAHKPSHMSIAGIGRRELSRTYALRATLLAKMGRMDEAEQAYRQWKATGYHHPVDDEEMLAYLMTSHRDREALQVAIAYRQFLVEQGDSLSFRLMSIHNREARIHAALGEYKEAAGHLADMGIISDSLRLQTLRNQSQTTYSLLQSRDDASRKTFQIYSITLVATALLVLALVIIYYTSVIRRHNKTMVSVLNSLATYREVFKDTRIPLSPEAAAALEQIDKYGPATAATADESAAADDEDRHLFVEMDMRVSSERLFLNPGFGRDELMRIVGVDKNRFGRMMSKYSEAGNASLYVSYKRVEYGAQLLLQHPEYTIATIAAECGMGNTVTFNRTFKEFYNLTPSEYRQRYANTANGGGVNFPDSLFCDVLSRLPATDAGSLQRCFIRPFVIKFPHSIDKKDKLLYCSDK